MIVEGERLNHLDREDDAAARRLVEKGPFED
jgi:hypothetical protein